MPALESSASAVTAIPLAGVLAIVDGADAFGFSARSADSPNPPHGRDADRG